jgi:hypothetical protein
MKLTTLSTLLVLLLGLTASCKNDQEDAAVACGTPAPTGYRVFLQVKQDPPITSSAPSELALYSNDSEDYTCGNYMLLTSLQRNGNTIHLDYCGIDAPTVCLASIGPAVNITSLQDIPVQRYNLNINVRGRTTTGSLDLTTSPASLTIADPTVAAVRP